jgi:hypothetical protein
MQMPAPLESADSDPLPLPVRQSSLWAWITPALSVAILAFVAWHFRNLDLDQLVAVVPRNPLFWVVFFAYYFTGTLADFAIFRWLWKIPSEGLIALARKNIGNELIVDYLGEAYFYSWARRKVTMEASPFGAVKDVAILSALVSNLFTLAMMALVWPYAKTFNFNFGLSNSALWTSVGVIITISLLVALFSRRLFSLSRAQLWGISGIHFLRLLIANALLAFAWSLALPEVPITWWLALATFKMLLGRLPLISNKDVAFAGFAVLVVGHDTEIQVLMAFMTALILATHLTLGAILAIGDLVTIHPSRREVTE